MISDSRSGLDLEAVAGRWAVDVFLVVRKGKEELARIGLYAFSFPTSQTKGSVFFAINQAMMVPGEIVEVTIKENDREKLEFFYVDGEFLVTIGNQNLIFTQDQVLNFFLHRAARVAGCR